jgi:hypothetical protein
VIKNYCVSKYEVDLALDRCSLYRIKSIHQVITNDCTFALEVVALAEELHQVYYNAVLHPHCSSLLQASWRRPHRIRSCSSI